MRSAALLLLLVLACAPDPSTPARLEGRVTSASGQPVEGAVVALMPAHPAWKWLQESPTGRVRSGADGRFRFDGIPAGEYVLSSTAPGHAPGFKAGVMLEAGATVRDQALALEAAGTRVQGRVRAEGGTSPEGAWVAVSPEGSRSGHVAYVQADDRGAYAMSLAPGGYALGSTHEDFLCHPRSFTVTATPHTASEDVQLLLPPRMTPPAPEVLPWLQDTAVPLATVKAGHGFEDLQPLEGWLAGARVVALGEATHGSREFFQLKHRMLEFLVTRMGFTVFVLEADFGASRIINDYVLTGRGDPAAALRDLYLWPWDTEEVLALIHWMRAYNANPAHEQKVQFLGVDMQNTPASADALVDYFSRVDISYGPQVAEWLQPLLDIRWRYRHPAIRNDLLILQRLQALEARLQERHAAYASQSSEQAWALAVQHLRVLFQLMELLGDPDQRYGLRDRAMAENARWLLEHEGPGAKMVLWAHNSHVSTTSLHSIPFMGSHLRQALGESLYVFGFVFNQGDLRAKALGESQGPVRTHTLPPAPEHTFDAVLARTGPPLFALDLRGAPTQGPIAEFLTQPRESRLYGAVYDERLPRWPMRAALDYDGLLFIDRVHASVPTP